MEDDPLETVINADQALFAARLALYEAVLDARALDATWQEIADVLGVSRQACQERFSRPQPGAQRRGGRPLQSEQLW